VVDDTFNANPAGAAAALEVLARHRSREGKAVVVTPGMIELGPEQHEENKRFAEAAAGQATHLVVVGRTNRAALLEGARGGTAEVLTMATRDDAVAWVRSTLAAGDVVLYENDLPDHYP
jgi:UDP-N-acetylmuramoyl-tripeptide--D-alanyl-D-alanine ligase